MAAVMSFEGQCHVPGEESIGGLSAVGWSLPAAKHGALILVYLPVIYQYTGSTGEHRERRNTLPYAQRVHTVMVRGVTGRQSSRGRV